MGKHLVLIFWNKMAERSRRFVHLMLQKYENGTYLKCINHFCRRSSVFENECSDKNELNEELFYSFENKISNNIIS